MTRACVAPETKVLLSDGKQIEIKYIKEGDIVQSYDAKNYKNTTGKVVGIITRNEPLIKIITRSGILRAAPDQYIYTTTGLKQARSVNKGDVLRSIGQEYIVDDVEKSDAMSDTYDLKIDSFRNFFAEGILVQSVLPEDEEWFPFIIEQTLNSLMIETEDEAKDAFYEGYQEYQNRYPIKWLVDVSKEDIIKGIINTYHTFQEAENKEL